MTEDNAERGEEANLDEREKDEVEEHLPLRAPMIYEIVRRQGLEELRRPVHSLWWSGLAAGIALSTSVYFESFLHHYLPDAHWRPLVENFGYSFGFLLVILGRLQLFTENTITVVLPLLIQRNLRALRGVARLWGVVLCANIVGTLLSAAIAVYGGIAEPQHLEAALALARSYVDNTPMEMLLKGIPAGFLVATLVWTLPGSRGNEFWVIVAVTYVIALGGLTHVVAGATEVFMLVFTGEVEPLRSVVAYLLPTLVGNIVGGTMLFSVLAYGQISEEL